ncbi:hypothetical protein INT46_007995 [Mucor plumbeus]|uniref:F-box domain-containing protein n=1 Tax=Mucor plumbeus TaxID=97098 RepID=A0A8H7RMR2_9FUNG|nr:hypothetical protein INT46_007995 [Mucor plumbeus]
MLALEILDNIFSHLAYSEIYRIRSVCKTWKQQCEYHLYLSIKSNRKKIYVKIGEKGKTTLVDMVPCDYDAENQVIEFKSQAQEEDDDEDGVIDDNDDDGVYLDQNTTHAKTQIQFSEWCKRETSAQNSELLLNLNLVDRAQVLFHLQYNPSMEQVYDLKLPKDDKNEMHYLGDKGIIMAYSYTEQQQQQQSDNTIQFHGLEDPVIPNTFNSIFDQVNSNRTNAAANNNTIRLSIHSINANLSWLLAGFNSGITPETIYPRRYQTLTDTLLLHDVVDKRHFCAHSEFVLKCIITMKQDATIDPHALSELLKQPAETISWKEKLQAKLQSIGIDPRVIYKYTFVKNYILQQHPPITGPDVVAKVIQESEEAWIVKKLNLIRELRKF